MAQTARKLIAIAVVEHENHFLVGTRDAGASLAGYAEFPGGKVESGESPTDAAVRECREETGIEVHAERLLQETDFDYSHGRLNIHFILCRPLDPSFSRALPLQGSFHWVPRTELSTLKFPPANEELLKILLSGPSYKSQSI